MTVAVPVFDGPTAAGLVELAVTSYRQRMQGGEAPAVALGEFVVRYLAARGLEVRPVDLDDVPDEVAEAVADQLTPDDLPHPDSSTTDLVHRVMRATWAATRAHLTETS